MNPVASLGVVAVGAGVLSYLLGFPARTLLERKGVLDRPNDRSSHHAPTVRGGGVAMVAVLAIAGIGSGIGSGAGWVPGAVTGAMLLLAVVSFVDDLRSLAAWIRFGCHALAALVAIGVLGLPELRVGFGAGWDVVLPGVVAAGLSFLWITGYTNAFNFMDGINGLAGGQALVTGLGMAGLAVMGGVPPTHWAVLLSAVLAAAAGGFLPHNFPRARMFMGDVGSASVGYLLAVIVLALAVATGGRMLVPLVLLHANFFLDTGITLARRVLRGEAWHKPHREHFYQRLIRSGRTHSFVTGTEMALQVVCAGLVFCWAEATPLGRLGILGAVVMVWGGFFVYSERVFCRVPVQVSPPPATV